MSCAGGGPVACPVALMARPGISSGGAVLRPVVPTTLMTCPSVAACCGDCSSPAGFHLFGDDRPAALGQRGGFIACPLALCCFTGPASHPYSSSSPVPSNEGVNLVVSGRRRDGGVL